MRENRAVGVGRQAHFELASFIFLKGKEMRQSISDLLNTINIEKIDSMNIDHKNRMVKLTLLDREQNSYELQLLGVDNYHYIDDYIYIREDEKKNLSGVSFYDSMPWGYVAISFDSEGNVIKKVEVEPNFVVNSKERSLCLKIKEARLDGNFYPVFKNSFLSKERGEKDN